MPSSFIRGATLCCVLSSLAACSNSGGSGFTSFEDLPENGSVEIDGQEVTARFLTADGDDF